MRLLIAVSNPKTALEVRQRLYGQDEAWHIETAADEAGTLRMLCDEPWDLLLLQASLPNGQNERIFSALQRRPPLSPPRILLLWEGLGNQRKPPADCVAPPQTEPEKLCRLLSILAEKPLPKLAAAHEKRIDSAIEQFLDALGMNPALKGRAYARWLLRYGVASPGFLNRSVSGLYQLCAQDFHTTPAAVERCLRVAVEGVFTLGKIQGIERYFGATVDPERGKPTNRAFLLQAAVQLRLLLNGSALREEQRNAP